MLCYVKINKIIMPFYVKISKKLIKTSQKWELQARRGSCTTPSQLQEELSIANPNRRSLNRKESSATDPSRERCTLHLL